MSWGSIRLVSPPLQNKERLLRMEMLMSRCSWKGQGPA